MDFLARLPFLKGRLSFARMSQKVGILMKKEHWMTKADLLLILLLVGGSLFFLIEPIFRSRDLDQRWLSVQVDGKLVDEIPLDQNKEKKSYSYRTEFGTNIIQIDHGQAFVSEADCPDKLCMRQGKISRPGAMIVCLPNRFVVEVKSKGPEGNSDHPDIILH